MYTVNNGSSIHQVMMAIEWGGGLGAYTNGKPKPAPNHQPTVAATCQLIRPNQRYVGKQALTYQRGISAESVGAKGISMHLLTMPPGAQGKAHYHKKVTIQARTLQEVTVTGQAQLWSTGLVMASDSHLEPSA